MTNNNEEKKDGANQTPSTGKANPEQHEHAEHHQELEHHPHPEHHDGNTDPNVLEKHPEPEHHEHDEHHEEKEHHPGK